jgi:hypothetical protein
VIIYPDDLANCRATDLQRVLRRLANADGFNGAVLVSATDEGYMAKDGAPVAPVSCSLHGGHLRSTTFMRPRTMRTTASQPTTPLWLSPSLSKLR